MRLGERIAYFRRQKGMTQEELSRAAGLGHNAVNRYETGSSDVSANALKAICEVLKVPPDVLIGDGEERFFVKLDNLAYMPERAHNDDAGFDLRSPKYDLLLPKADCVIDTGVHVAIPKGYAGLIISKSGLNMKNGILSDGLIDAGYTGSIRVKLYNMSNNTYEIQPGDKISQLVFIPIAEPNLIEVDTLSDTDRGDNGFGSSGR